MHRDLIFNETDHAYFFKGERVPSVTQVLKPLAQFEGIPLATLRAAAKRGQFIHAAIHLDNQGILDLASVPTLWRPYIAAWQKYIRESEFIVVASEVFVVHKHLKYAGQLDSIVERGKERCICDIKTGAVPKSVGMQTSGYREAYIDEHPTRRLAQKRLCVQLNSDGSYKQTIHSDPNDFNLFKSQLNIHQWKTRNGYKN